MSVASVISLRVALIPLVVLSMLVPTQLVHAVAPVGQQKAPTRAASKIQLPPVGAKFDYQLGGAAKLAPGVKVVVRDRTARIAAGSYNICYVNGFQTQPQERSFWRKRQNLLLKRNGRPVIDSAWGETLLDIRTAKKRNRLAKIMNKWVAGCARAGFKAVEFDNLDSYLRSKKLIKLTHVKKYAKLLTRGAHRNHLAVAQKNWAEFNGRKVGFDFAIAESCGRYRECASYTKNFGRRVLAVEYRKQDFNWTCKNFGGKVSVVLRDVPLSPHGIRKWC